MRQLSLLLSAVFFWFDEMADTDDMFPYSSPIYCGYCHHTAFTRGDTVLSCGHKFHLDCLKKWNEMKPEVLCPQCANGGQKVFQCSHCGLDIEYRGEAFEAFCECVYHITCLQRLIRKGLKKCSWCQKRLDHYDYEEMKNIKAQCKFFDIVNID